MENENTLVRTLPLLNFHAPHLFLALPSLATSGSVPAYVLLVLDYLGS